MQDIVCAVIYSTAPANFWVPPPQKFHYVRIVERKNTTCFPPFLCRGGVSPPAKRTNNTATICVTPYSAILRALFLFSHSHLYCSEWHFKMMFAHTFAPLLKKGDHLAVVGFKNTSRHGKNIFSLTVFANSGIHSFFMFTLYNELNNIAIPI